MSKSGVVLVVFVLCLSLTGCAATIKQPEWKFEKESIRVHIKADHKLNLYNSKAHTLYVCFYQLSELNKFDELTKDDAGIHKLLECKLFDPSVAAVNNKIIHAGENLTFILDRAERAEYFAIVTGYFAKLDNARMIRRHRIQVFKKRVSFWKSKYRCMPCNLNIELKLGPNQIEYSKVITTDRECSDECQ
ncbi:MAG: type VI secretion lipoprotein TssJ [Desulfobacteraceae bacterium]|jgi:predicted component of type VI protein secretion system